MGAWGHGSFENDDAMDWVGMLSEEKDPSLLDSALEAVAECGEEDYIEAPDGAIAIAAAEAVAALNDRPAAGLPHDLQETLAGFPKPDAALLARARAAVAAALSERSELRELWEESEHYDGWRASLDDLRSRLS